MPVHRLFHSETGRGLPGRAHRQIACLCLCLVISMLSFHAARAQTDGAGPEPSKAFAELEGIWIAETITTAGVPVPQEKFPFEIHFKPPDQMIYRGIKVGGVTRKDRIHDITLDRSKKPAAMDIKRREMPHTVMAIYKVEKDRLTICMRRSADRQPATGRPMSFESDATTKTDLLVLRKSTESQ